MYGQLEGWDAPDTVYFSSVVTSTSVGFGNLCPETPAGRLFTCLYATRSSESYCVLMSAMTPEKGWVM